MWHLVTFVALLAITAYGVPVDTITESLVLTTTDVPATSVKTSEADNVKKGSADIYAFNVLSRIGSRYATTLVSSKLKNNADTARTAAFSVVLPETAFISGFLMEIEGKVYKAHVKEKEEAKRVYNAAVQGGLAAAHVALSARDSNRFTVDVSVPATQKATFNLTYEELLSRRVGVYNHVLNLNPGQIVKEMSVDVFIDENRPITTLRVPELRSGNEVTPDESDPNNSVATIMRDEKDKTKAHIRFAPTPDQQARLMMQLVEKEKKDDHPTFNPFVVNTESSNVNSGLKGQFVVQYDVERDPAGGEVLVYDGYFVHFFAPDDLKSLPKHVVFVLDTSGSMHGRKIEQLRTAMSAILSDLKPEDFFHIINFSFAAKVWNLDDPSTSPSYSSPNVHWWGPKEETNDKENPPPAAYPANENYLSKAKEEVSKLEANGGTNIYDSLEIAMRVANRGVDSETLTSGVPKPEPLIIFLTDGDPTVGETDLNKIYTMVDESKVSDKPPTIFSLAFGDDADRNFLRKISLRNGGFLRHIYEAGDASRQLQNFYREVSSPLLAGVKFTYPSDQIDEQSLTRRSFPHLFMGSELVVAGRMQSDAVELEPEVKAVGASGSWSTTGIVKSPIAPIRVQHKPAPLERLWAYLMIKQLLDEKDSQIDIDSTHKVDEVPHAEPNALQPTNTKDTAKGQALKLALKYSFVTPLTSLVVVKPNATDSSVDTETAKPGSNGGHALPLSFAAPSMSHRSSPVNFGGAYFSKIRTRVSGGPGLFAFAGQPASGTFPSSSSSLVLGPPGMSIAGIGGGFAGVDRVDLYKVSVENEESLAFDVDESFSTTSLPEHHQELNMFPWLAGHLHESKLEFEENGMRHSYNFTSLELPSQPECDNAVSSGSGKCVPLLYCPGAQNQIISLDIYRKFFCTVEGFAGVCCDENNRQTDSLP
ncbi:inter-alpha-trypsin inhibitor heavy chain H4-like isoform X2 [Ctenocephalides felis]|uniref:inter-alpha-trypsin inhibitor heavy chain H4-like isoform X2 n=1 Tax=Ctenocephalides felis TaxID=7515 RepID=UPI000E6E4B6F|nr:inter-alpha-trypsin inhibitor heavy chain H4-like isoform X2 [Ctenocephalides felis]